ncbi:hypothetical protein [Glycomyces sp. NPDC047010]|uniref:hypothetical protein n=1 Tax=Glycomyces sp. NPDC047010 TaxID=3155023 RepID=UPI0033C07A89
MTPLIMVAVFALVFLVTAGLSFTAVGLNLRMQRAVRGQFPIPPDLSEPITGGTGFPWHSKYRAQPWPDPNAAVPMLSVESARRYAGAAERRARRCLLVGDAAIFLLAIPAGLFIPLFSSRWPEAPGNEGWILISLVLSSMIGGLALKIYATPYWEAVRDAYEALVERLESPGPADPSSDAAGHRVRPRFERFWRRWFD